MKYTDSELTAFGKVFPHNVKWVILVLNQFSAQVSYRKLENKYSFVSGNRIDI